MKKILVLLVIAGLLPALMVGCQSIEGKALTSKYVKESSQNSTEKQDTKCQSIEGKALTSKYVKESSQNSTEKQDTKITMYLEKPKYNLPINEITLQIKNLETDSYQFGQYYTIEIYQDNAWRKIPFKKNTGFDDILYTLESGKTHSQIINLQGLDYKITKGKYRISKDFNSNGNKITLETEFNID